MRDILRKDFKAFLEDAVKADPEDKNIYFAQSWDAENCPLAAWYKSMGYTEVSVGPEAVTYRNKHGLESTRKMPQWAKEYVRNTDAFFRGNWILPREALSHLEKTA